MRIWDNIGFGPPKRKKKAQGKVPPPPNRFVIEQRAKTIQDPIERLRFLRNHAASGLLLEEGTASSDRPSSQAVSSKLLSTQKFLRRKPALGVALAVAAGLLMASGFSVVRVQKTSAAAPPVRSASAERLPSRPARPRRTNPTVDKVWLVDQKGGVEIYSNGLRIETRYETLNTPRGTYYAFPRGQADMEHALRLEEPSGIVYHTTESILAPFAADQNKILQRISSEVLTYVQRNHSYHFLIDRFGRVYRVVKETEVAFHAGSSVWGDSTRVFLNLNQSFLGIAFETQTAPDHGMPTATPAQIDAARVLTELLRDRYQIPAEDCVTHAQVSVNPSNMLIGYHTDWAGKFPFPELELKDNYSQPPASLTAFGFDYDPAFVASTGSRLMPGLLAADAELRDRASKLKCSVPQLKAMLRNNYREIAAAEKSGETAKETESEK